MLTKFYSKTALLAVVTGLISMSGYSQNSVRPYTQVYSENLKGGTVLFGNTMMHIIDNNAVNSTKMNESGFPFQKSTVLLNIYEAQLKKIRSALEKLHEDLQYDYSRALPALEAAGKKKAFWRFWRPTQRREKNWYKFCRPHTETEANSFIANKYRNFT